MPARKSGVSHSGGGLVRELSPLTEWDGVANPFVPSKRIQIYYFVEIPPPAVSVSSSSTSSWNLVRNSPLSAAGNQVHGGNNYNTTTTRGNEMKRTRRRRRRKQHEDYTSDDDDDDYDFDNDDDEEENDPSVKTEQKQKRRVIIIPPQSERGIDFYHASCRLCVPDRFGRYWHLSSSKSYFYTVIEPVVLEERFPVLDEYVSQRNSHAQTSNSMFLNQNDATTDISNQNYSNYYHRQHTKKSKKGVSGGGGGEVKTVDTASALVNAVVHHDYTNDEEYDQKKNNNTPVSSSSSSSSSKIAGGRERRGGEREEEKNNNSNQEEMQKKHEREIQLLQDQRRVSSGLEAQVDCLISLRMAQNREAAVIATIRDNIRFLPPQHQQKIRQELEKKGLRKL